MDANELLARYAPGLRKVNPEFDPSWVKARWRFCEPAGQPVVTVGYRERIPPLDTAVPGLVLANTTQIYPEDRGTNYAVRLGEDAARAARAAGGGVISLDRREKRLLLAAVLLAVIVRIAYIAATRGHTLAGDEFEYNREARFFAGGDWFFSLTSFGNPHQTTWKSPAYGTFLGVLYSVFGGSVDRSLVVQNLLVAPLVVGLTFLLGVAPSTARKTTLSVCRR